MHAGVEKELITLHLNVYPARPSIRAGGIDFSADAIKGIVPRDRGRSIKYLYSREAGEVGPRNGFSFARN